MNLHVDINCDMGEGMSTDGAIMPYISSANIACGFHAGNKDTMKHTVELCLIHQVAIGAHPSFLDKENFGRLDMMEKGIGLKDIPQIMEDQLFVLEDICIEMGTKIHHVKPHGALYNRAVWDQDLAKAICTSIHNINPSLLLYGSAYGKMKTEAQHAKLRFVAEAFADRTYQADGSLTPRSQPGALIDNADQALQQAMQIIQYKNVTNVSGNAMDIDAQTICLHGDGTHAVVFAKSIFNHLKQHNIVIQSIH